MPYEVWDEITYPFPNVNGGIWEWIGNFTPNFAMDASTYPCCDFSYTMQKGPLAKILSLQ